MRAENIKEAADIIRNRQCCIIRIARLNLYDRLKMQLPYSDRQRMLFFRRLAVLLKSGMPLLQSLKLISANTDGRTADICRNLCDSLYGGQSMSEAMAGCSGLFDPLSAAMAEAGERSGRMEMVFEELALYYGRRDELRNFVIRSALYPAFLLISSACVLLFFLLYVLPVLGEAYASLQIRDTGLLQWLLAANNVLSEYGNFFLIFLISGLILFHRLISAVLLKKMTGSLLGNFTEVRVCRLIGMLLESGVSITEAVKLAASASGDGIYAGRLLMFCSLLRQGSDIETAARKVPGLFCPLTEGMIAVGAATGYLPEMFNEAAELLEKDMRARLERLREIFAPLLLLAAAFAAGAVIYSVTSPLFGLIEAVPGHL